MTAKPRSIKFVAIGSPILPRPITPTLSMPKLYAVWVSGGKRSGGETACSLAVLRRLGCRLWCRAEVERLRLVGQRRNGGGHGVARLFQPGPGQGDGSGRREPRAAPGR